MQTRPRFFGTLCSLKNWHGLPKKASLLCLLATVKRIYVLDIVVVILVQKSCGCFRGSSSRGSWSRPRGSWLFFGLVAVLVLWS